MNLNKVTIKAQEAIQEAVKVCKCKGNKILSPSTCWQVC